MIVIDASVGLKWIQKEEEYRNKARTLYKNHLLEKEKIVIPELFFIEISNALVTKANVPQNKIRRALKFVYDLNLQIHVLTHEHVSKTCSLAKKYSTTAYDMLYAVIAKQNKAILVTSDEGFIQKTGFKFVKHLKDI